VYAGVEGLSGVRPLRRRLFCGGCSRVEYQQIAAAGSSPAPSTDALLRVSWNGAGGVISGLVFGTLLGPEATGPGGFLPGAGLFLVSWLHRARTVVLPLFGGRAGVWGVWYGVVV
jgi:hypothetical protein